MPAKSLAEELAINVRWQKIPGEYLACSPAELDERIGAARRALGDSVTVLGHHYQREEIIKYADFQGGLVPVKPGSGVAHRGWTTSSSAASISWRKPRASWPATTSR